MDGAIEMNYEKISVIVPVYKVEPYLRRCLDSIVRQTYRNLEIILVDDGSPDNCGAICDEYARCDRRITVIHQGNNGVASARNAGLKIATGSWIAWVDSDDWIEPDMLQYLYEGAVNYQADVSACGTRTAGLHKPSFFQYEEVQRFDREQALRELLLGGKMTGACWDKLAKRKLWEGLNFPDLKIGEDLLTVGRLLERADVMVCLPEIKYNYLARPESALTKRTLENRLDFWRAANRQYKELGPKWPQMRSALAGRSAAAAIGVWSAYLYAKKDLRKKLLPELEEIAVFSRNHFRDALTHVNLGLTGRIALRVTPYRAWWAFSIAKVAGWFYQKKHKKAL